MYTIQEASKRSGVGVSLIRAWERRYGLVAPTRTAAGYRLYDDEAVDRLRRVRRLIGSGWRASEATRAVLADEDHAITPAPAATEGPEPGRAEVLGAAGRIGYREVRLDTLPEMAAAIALYERAGFVRTAAYYETPVEGTVFFARAIGPGGKAGQTAA